MSPILLLLAAAPLAAQQGRWRAEERVVLRDFSVVRAVAASDALVFGATDAGLIVRDRQFRRWLPPLTELDGYPTAPVHAAWAEGFGQTLWLATAAGLVRYEPMLQRFEVNPLQQPAERDRWTLPDLYRRHPAAEALGAQVLLDARLRRHRFTAVARVPGTEEFWLGTSGLGLVQFDALIAQFEPEPFGLLADGVGALIAMPDGLWIATDGRGRREGLTFTTPDLDQWRWEEGPRATGFGLGLGGFRDGLARGRVLWLASAAGVWRVEPGAMPQPIGTGAGLPSADVRALAQGPAGVWIGTDRGLVLLDAEDVVRTAALGHTVLALAAARDTVWVGTADGLGQAWPGAERIQVRDDVARVPELRGPVLAVARVADTLVAVTPDRVVWSDTRSGVWTVEPPLVELGTLRVALGDAGGVWIGGDHGLAWFHFATRAVRVFTDAGDLPGPVRALAQDAEYLWVGTDRGLVRFRTRSLRP